MSSPSPLIQVYVLSYNRPEYITEVVHSVLSQDYENFQVIVSDNSTKDDVENELRPYLEKHGFKYIRRKPSLSALTHFNTILNELTSDFFMLFHDDDVMNPGALNRLSNEMLSNKSYVAIGSNAQIIRDRELTKYLFAPYKKQDVTIKNAEDLARHYLISSLGHVPFPSYLYRTSAVKDLNMDFKQGGKHADVSFLLKLANRGQLRWVAQPLLNYRRHSSNDSLSIDMRALFSLCRFLKKHTDVDPKLIYEFKMKNSYAWSRQKARGLAKPLSPLRDKIIMQSAFYFLALHPLVILKSLVRRIFKRQQYDYKNSLFKK